MASNTFENRYTRSRINQMSKNNIHSKEIITTECNGENLQVI